MITTIDALDLTVPSQRTILARIHWINWHIVPATIVLVGFILKQNGNFCEFTTVPFWATRRWYTGAMGIADAPNIRTEIGNWIRFYLSSPAGSYDVMAGLCYTEGGGIGYNLMGPDADVMGGLDADDVDAYLRYYASKDFAGALTVT